MTQSDRLKMLNSNDNLSISTQCKLLNVNRSMHYYTPCQESPLNLELMKKIDRQYLDHQWGQLKMCDWLRLQGYQVNIKRVRRLYKILNIEGLGPKPNTSKSSPNHEVYPYLIRGWRPIAPNQLWSGDITYIPVMGGYLYLFAIIDWYSRYILSWRLSNTMDVNFCVEALEEALSKATPLIWNSDQGTQFTSSIFINILKEKHIAVSMDGVGRAIDNIFIERFWRSLKYEEVYPNDYQNGKDSYCRLAKYIPHYNEERPHQSLNGIPPLWMHNNHKKYEKTIDKDDYMSLKINQEWTLNRFNGNEIIGKRFRSKRKKKPIINTL